MIVTNNALLLLLVATGAQAFAPGTPLAIRQQATAVSRRGAASGRAFSPLRMQEQGREEGEPAEPAMKPAKAAAIAMDEVYMGNNPVMAKTLSESMMPKNQDVPRTWFMLPGKSVLTGDEPGYYGFDPLALAKTNVGLRNYQEAELKHGRLAMLATAGWVFSENFHETFANAAGMPNLLQVGQVCQNAAQCVEGLTRAPSVLNGGLNQISPVYWGLVLGLSAGIELYSQKRAATSVPGDLGFDPLNILKGKDAAAQRRMAEAEIKHGRLAMLGITGFAFQELATKTAVVVETPAFFKPALIATLLN